MDEKAQTKGTASSIGHSGSPCSRPLYGEVAGGGANTLSAELKGPNRCCVLGGRICSSLTNEPDPALLATLSAAKYRESISIFLVREFYLGYSCYGTQHSLFFCILYNFFQPESSAYPAHTMRCFIDLRYG